MREINQLPEKVRAGRVGVKRLQRMLSYEHYCAEPKITMSTLGIFSGEYTNREKQAEQELTESQLVAGRNIPIIEGLLRELGATTDVPPYKSYFADNVRDGNGFGE